MNTADASVVSRLERLRKLTEDLNLHTPPPYFASEMTTLPYEEALAPLWQDLAGGPLSLYLGVPLCVEHCRFCMYFYGLADEEGAKAEACVRGIEEFLRHVAGAASRRPVAGSYVGGGTPTVLSAGQIERVLAAVDTAFTFEPGAQRTFEMSPGTTSPEKARAIVAGGYDRVSFGVQSFSPEVVKATGRTFTSVDEARAVVRSCQDVGVAEINIDLMVGLADETDETVLESVGHALSSGCTTISIYRYRPARESEVRGRGGVDHYVMTCATRIARAAELAVRRGWHVEGRTDGEHVRFVDTAVSVQRAERNFYETRHRPRLGNSLVGIGSGGRSFNRNRRFVHCTPIPREHFGLLGRSVEVQDCDVPARAAAALVNELFREWTVDTVSIELDTGVTLTDLFGPELAYLLDERVLVQDGTRLSVAAEHRTDWMYYEKLLYPVEWLARRGQSTRLRAR